MLLDCPPNGKLLSTPAPFGDSTKVAPFRASEQGRTKVFVMPGDFANAQASASGERYQALLAVCQAIVSHRELPALFHELGGRLRHVVNFDYLSLVLHEASTNTMRMHLLEATEPIAGPLVLVLSVEDDPAGLVWQNQQPLITKTADEIRRWPRLMERVQGYGIESYCWLPLTTARRRLGTLVFACKQPHAYDTVEAGFLQLVANQVAVAVENALAFQEIDAAFRQIEALKNQLAKEKAYLEDEARTEHNFSEIVGRSGALKRVLQQVETVAPTASTVLIRGETGTGKELIARSLHELSPRKDRTFVKLNCSAIPTGLLESELFGHEKGAFTGAIAQKIGRFEVANHGTLFLDEVGDIPLELQPKLLRVLQEQEFERLGGTKTIKVDVRLVAATHRDLAKMVAAGRFREDLYYRLNVFPVTMPPLRERADDIPRLVAHFTQRFARRMGRRIESIPTEVMEALAQYPWPGNVRELQNIIERAVILSAGAALQVPLSDLQQSSGVRNRESGVRGDNTSTPDTDSTSPATDKPITLADAERAHIVSILRETNWVLGGPKGAAARLGMNRSTLQWKIKKLGISQSA